MATKKVEALGGELAQIKSGMEEKFSTMERMEGRLGGIEKIIKKLMEMQSQASWAVPITSPHHNLTKGPMAKLKGKEIEREEFDEKSSFHQEPPLRTLIMGGIEVSKGGTAEKCSMVEFMKEVVGDRPLWKAIWIRGVDNRRGRWKSRTMGIGS
ncbi:hypothetical protein MA16_Dca013377 [Dendrobium catenatum]|uniref:Uncharacterized protein n=1 Tax=Dendrobium catenatum TaxID=906689 RepID=A0A2I0VIY8_9ASPA|nr:hypothetical protein MA16_Dca013377 [Dendrobium catenatum]